MSRVLVTGATGYVGTRLIPRLLDAGHDLRITSRDPSSIAGKYPTTEALPSDVMDPASLETVLEGIEIAYYLVHSMAGSDFEAADRTAARNFAAACERAGVERIVYLGGLGRASDDLSKHLRSRQEVGAILQDGPVQVIELRAAIVIGNGSAAFEMLRELTERLPMMIAPRWLSTDIQPIAEHDLLTFLELAASVEVSGHRVIEVGGADVLDYRQMILGYAAERGLRRLIVSVPVLTPRLSSYWVNLVTSADSAISVPLIEGLRNEVIVTDPKGMALFGDVQPVGYRAAVRAALQEHADSPNEVQGSGRGFLVDRQVVVSDASPDALMRYLGSIGGDASWYPLRWAWWIRARLDDLFGGAGLKWRRPASGLEPGARVDWWTVETAGSDHLVLRAEMKVPGDAWLAWRAVPDESGTRVEQTAYFRPRGLLGRAYWWGLYPFHVPIFKAMAARIAERAA